MILMRFHRLDFGFGNSDFGTIFKRCVMIRYILFFLLVFFSLLNGTDNRIDYVLVSWQENSESDLAGYFVHWGKGSRQYSDSVDVGLNDELLLKKVLSYNVEYFFSVTAYDTAGNMSGYGEEAEFIKFFVIDTIPPLPGKKPIVKELFERK